MDHKLSAKGWLFGPWWLGRRFSFVVSRDDLWMGFYWNREEGILYFCPLPMLVLGFKFRGTPRSRGD